MGPTAVDEMTIPQLSHSYDSVLSVDVRMWDKVCILGEKIFTCKIIAVSSRSLIIMSPLGLVSRTGLACVYV